MLTYAEEGFLTVVFNDFGFHGLNKLAWTTADANCSIITLGSIQDAHPKRKATLP